MYQDILIEITVIHTHKNYKVQRQKMLSVALFQLERLEVKMMKTTKIKPILTGRVANNDQGGM